MRAVKVPQTFVYAAKVPDRKKIRGLLFRHGEPMVIHDPKMIRLLERLPYMKVAEDAIPDPEAKPAKRKGAAPLVQIEIPADWQDQHWKRRKMWAKAISGQEITDLAEADAILANYKPAPVAPAEPEAGADLEAETV